MRYSGHMVTRFFTWYRRFMQAAFALAIVDFIVLAGMYLAGRPTTHGFFVALWVGFCVAAVAGSSLLKARSLTRLEP